MLSKKLNKPLSIAVLLAFATISLIFLGCGKKEPAVIKIGAVLPLTGSAAVWGQNAKKGMDIAVDEINSAGGIKGKKIEILYEDSKTESKTAVSALRKLISTENVPVVIGDIASSSVLAMAPVAESEKVVLLSPGASNPDISHAGEYIFRNWQSDALEGEVDARYAYNNLGWKQVAILYVKNAYGEGLFRAFKDSFVKLGGKIVLEESFDQGAITFRGQLTKVKNVEIDGIYLPGYPDEMAKLLKQSKELGIQKPFLSVQAFDDPQILKIAGDAAEGVIFSVPKPPDESQDVVRNFRETYRERYQVEPGVCSDTGYDAVKIIAQAIENGGYNAEAIKKQLESLKNFPGAAGETTFNEYGDVVKPFIFKIVKKGQFVEQTP